MSLLAVSPVFPRVLQLESWATRSPRSFFRLKLEQHGPFATKALKRDSNGRKLLLRLFTDLKKEVAVVAIPMIQHHRPQAANHFVDRASELKTPLCSPAFRFIDAEKVCQRLLEAPKLDDTQIDLNVGAYNRDGCHRSSSLGCK